MKPKTNQRQSFFWRRVVLGILGFGCLIAWSIGYINMGWEGILHSIPLAIVGRIGLILTALWLALPTIEPLFRYGGSLFMGAILVVLFVLAVRPRIVPIVIGVIVVGSSVNWILRKMSGKPKSRQDSEE